MAQRQFHKQTIPARPTPNPFLAIFAGLQPPSAPLLSQKERKRRKQRRKQAKASRRANRS